MKKRPEAQVFDFAAEKVKRRPAPSVITAADVTAEQIQSAINNIFAGLDGPLMSAIMCAAPLLVDLERLDIPLLRAAIEAGENE